jgi:spore maturation protein CgeB
LEELIQNPELRKKIAEDGYRQIMSMPTWEEQTTKLEKILQNA